MFVYSDTEVLSHEVGVVTVIFGRDKLIDKHKYEKERENTVSGFGKFLS